MTEINDDGLPWGFVTEEGDWRVLPKGPMIQAGYGPPPFDIELPSGEVRRIIHQPKIIHCPRRRGLECETPNSCAGGADCRFGPDLNTLRI